MDITLINGTRLHRRNFNSFNNLNFTRTRRTTQNFSSIIRRTRIQPRVGILGRGAGLTTRTVSLFTINNGRFTILHNFRLRFFTDSRSLPLVQIFRRISTARRHKLTKAKKARSQSRITITNNRQSTFRRLGLSMTFVRITSFGHKHNRDRIHSSLYSNTVLLLNNLPNTNRTDVKLRERPTTLGARGT